MNGENATTKETGLNGREIAAPVDRVVRQFSVGDKVRVLRGDGDGAAGKVCTIGNLYKSGRCRVDLPDGGFRNLPPHLLERVE